MSSNDKEQFGRTKRKGRLKEEEEAQAETREMRKVENLRVRLIPIWLRLIIVIILAFVCLLAGAAVGYGVIGEGEPMDVFNKETWQHIIDIVKKEA